MWQKGGKGIRKNRRQVVAETEVRSNSNLNKMLASRNGVKQMDMENI